MDAALKNEIKEIFKKEGLDVAEEVVLKFAKVSFKVLPKILEATPNKLDDLLIPVLKTVEPKVLAAIDKIDGVEDNPVV